MTLEELVMVFLQRLKCVNPYYCPTIGYTIPHSHPYSSGFELLVVAFPVEARGLSPCVSLMVTDRSADEISYVSEEPGRAVSRYLGLKPLLWNSQALLASSWGVEGWFCCHEFVEQEAP